jgi:hypothetical protein
MRRTPHRLDILASFHLLGTRYNLKDVLARAERVRIELRYPVPFMCTCTMTDRGKEAHALRIVDVEGPKRRIRTRF